MATRKGVELRTDFTGSDKNFKPVLDRTRRGVRKLGTEARKAGTDGAKGLEKLKRKLTDIKGKAGAAAAAVATVSGAVLVQRTRDEEKRDILLNSQIADMGVERFQRLANVMKGFRIEADETADIMKELGKVTGEALKEPDSTKANAFKMLHLDIQKFKDLKPIEQLQQLSQSFEKIRQEEDGKRKVDFAMDELISDMGTKLVPLFKLKPEEFASRLVKAGEGNKILSEDFVRAGAKRFTEREAAVPGTLGLVNKRTFTNPFSRMFQSLKNEQFRTLQNSAFDPSINFDPDAEKKAKEVEKEGEKFEKLLNRINKPNSPLTLLGMTVNGVSMRPIDRLLMIQKKELQELQKGNNINQQHFELMVDKL
jgi:hypothetical protein